MTSAAEIERADEPRTARHGPVRRPPPAWRLTLAEEPIERLDVATDGWVEVRVGGWRLETIGFGFGPGA